MQSIKTGRKHLRPVASDALITRVQSMLIPYDQLEPDTLTRLIEDFVSRDGTDNGDDTPHETRVLRVRHALSKGQAVIFFDLESQQCQLVQKHTVPKEFFD